MSNCNGGPRTRVKQSSFGGWVNIKSTAIPNTHFNLQVQITFDVCCFFAKQTVVNQLNCFPDRMQRFKYWSLPMWVILCDVFFKNTNNIGGMLIEPNVRRIVSVQIMQRDTRRNCTFLFPLILSLVPIDYHIRTALLIHIPIIPHTSHCRNNILKLPTLSTTVMTLVPFHLSLNVHFL